MIKPWQKVRSKPAGDFRIFTIRTETKVSPRTGHEHDVHVIDSVNWVNIIAITADQQLVMVEQYRHGSNTVELEIPGGMMDPGETSPVATGVRELREETGYEGENARILGCIDLNPSWQVTKVHVAVVRNARRSADTDEDESEDIRVRLLDVAALKRKVREGEVDAGSTIAALALWEWKDGGFAEDG